MVVFIHQVARGGKMYQDGLLSLLSCTFPTLEQHRCYLLFISYIRSRWPFPHHVWIEARRGVLSVLAHLQACILATLRTFAMKYLLHIWSNFAQSLLIHSNLEFVHCPVSPIFRLLGHTDDLIIALTWAASLAYAYPLRKPCPARGHNLWPAALELLNYAWTAVPCYRLLLLLKGFRWFRSTGIWRCRAAEGNTPVDHIASNCNV